MRVLLTGNLGYIGTVMTRMLLADGHEVVGLDSDFYELCSFGDSFPEISQLKKDIRDVHPEELVGFDAVIHLAALSNDPRPPQGWRTKASRRQKALDYPAQNHRP